MQLPNTKIENVCPKEKDGYDGDRRKLTGVHYNAKQKRLEAADGFMLAVNPVPDATEEANTVIPVDAMKEARKLGRKKADTPALKVEGQSVTPGFVDKNNRKNFDGNTYVTIEGNYPDCEQIIPTDTEFVIAFDAARLKTLAEAICENGQLGVEIHVTPGSVRSPILVLPIDWHSKNKGVLMPMHSQRQDRR